MCFSLTVSMHPDYEVIPHGLGLSQLVGVAVVNHVIAADTEREQCHKHGTLNEL